MTTLVAGLLCLSAAQARCEPPGSEFVAGCHVEEEVYAFDSPQHPVQEAAERSIRWLAQHGGLGAVERLKKIAMDPASSVRSLAAWALVELMALDSVRDWVAARAVEEVGQPAAGFLIGALTHKDRNVRYRAAAILGRMAEKKAVDALQKALDDTDELVRRHSVVALGFIGDNAVAPALIRAMADSDGIVRENAIWALGMIKAKSAADEIVRALDDEDKNIRFRAINALAELGGERATEAIRKKLDDPDKAVAEAARNALKRLAAR